MRSEYAIGEFHTMVGTELGVSGWVEVTQEMIDAFAKISGDDQWIHTDPVRAANSPWGTTIAHGFLTLSLLTRLMDEVFTLTETEMSINYGLNKVRFPSPVPAGARLRARVTLNRCERVGEMIESLILVVIELDGAVKPACVAEVVCRSVPEQS